MLQAYNPETCLGICSGACVRLLVTSEHSLSVACLALVGSLGVD